MYSKIKKWNKLFHIAGDFNLNLLDHDTNRKVHRDFSIWSFYATRQTDHIAVDHVLTNFFTDVFKTVISKSDIYDHFSISVMILSSTKQTNNTKNTFMCRKAFDTESIELFKQKLYKTSWDDIEVSQNPMKFIKVFWINFLTYTTLIFLKNRSNQKVKICKVRGWQMVLKNFPNGNNAFMKNFKTIGMEKLSLNTKITKGFLNQLKTFQEITFS